MGISIEKLLTLPALRGSELIAGAAGRDNTIDGLAVIQTPSSINFLMKNNLVITNSQIFNLYPNFCDIVITELHKRGAAGIAIKVNDFLPKTPQAMIDDANLLKFPLIIQPNELSSTQLINAVTYEIMRSEVRDYELGYEENFLREREERTTIYNCHNEHDIPWCGSPEHHTLQHPCREHGECAGARPQGRDIGKSPIWRQ